jgi:hypothetical protein
MKIPVNLIHSGGLVMFINQKLRVLIPSIFFVFFQFSAFAATFDDAMTAYNASRYDTAIADFTYLAEKGNSEASYMVGKMYMDRRVPSEFDTSNAIFWFLMADLNGYPDATNSLREYSRRGYRLLIVAIEVAIKDWGSLYRRGHQKTEFPREVLEESKLYWKSLYSMQTPSDARTDALQNLLQMTDLELCREAISITLKVWDGSYRAAGAVEEVGRRDLTVKNCRDILTSAVQQ